MEKILKTSPRMITAFQGGQDLSDCNTPQVWDANLILETEYQTNEFFTAKDSPPRTQSQLYC